MSFDDTPDDVIVSLLDRVDGDEPPAEGDGGAAQQPPAPAPPGSILAEEEYWSPILRILVEAGGAAPANDVIAALGDYIGDALKIGDHDRLTNGEIRWRNRARFARLRMKERGLLSNTSRRGIWEITDAGRAYLEEHR
jgi:hypothetical protein